MSAKNALSPKGLYAIILAAGGSSRFGSPKQLACIGGRPLRSPAVGRGAATGGPSTPPERDDAHG